MLIIHTSDWHLGQYFYNYSRDEEHRQFVDQLTKEITLNKPDALIIAGDIFDVSVPTIQAQKLLVDILTRLHDACEQMKIILIAGNHDSASRLDIHAPIWRKINVEIVANVDNENPADNHIIRIYSANGKHCGNVVAIPYIAEYNYSRYGIKQSSGDESPELMIQNFHQQIIDEASKDNLPVIMTAHLAVAGSESWSHDQSKLSYHPISIMGKGYDYLALGHIHHPSSITVGNAVARYSGSPFKLSFDEDFTHTISIVSIDSHGQKPKIIEKELPIKTKTISFPDPPVDVESTIKLIKDLPNSNDDFIRINILADKQIDLLTRHKIEELVTEKGYRFCLVNTIQSTPIKKATTAPVFLTAESLQKADPIEIARNYYSVKYSGMDLPDNIEACLKTAITLSDKDLREE